MGIYTIRSHKRQALAPELPWSNTAEVICEGFATNEQAQGGMAAWRNYERALTFDIIQFHDATFSTWHQEAADVTAGDELFPWLGNVQLGIRGAPAAPAPLDDTLFINRIPWGGNKGKLFLRGGIAEAELQVTARKRVLTPSALASYETLNALAWETLQNDLAEFGLTLAMVAHPRIGWEQVPVAPGKRPKTRPVYDKTKTYTRVVMNMRVKGTTPLQLNQH